MQKPDRTLQQLVETLTLGSIVLVASKEEVKELYREAETYNGLRFAQSLEIIHYASKAQIHELRGHLVPIVATSALWNSLRTSEFLTLQSFLEKRQAKRGAVRRWATRR